MISKVLALSIGSVKRQGQYTGSMKKMGVSQDNIYFIRGRDPKDYEMDYALIAEAAAKDGFKFVRYFQGHGDTGIVKQTPAQMTQVWEFARILRYIANSDAVCLVTWDDRTLTIPFSMLQSIVAEQIEGYRENFFLFQLRLRGCPEYLNLEKFDFWEERYIHNELFSAFTNLGKDISYAEVFTKLGMHGYDESIVFSPTGAAWMLEQMQSIKDVDPDIKKIKYKDVRIPQKPTYCRTLNIDNYICWGLRDAIKTALKDSKGVFCPRYAGFDFIADDIIAGSDTDWASREYALRNEVNASEHYNYLELS